MVYVFVLFCFGHLILFLFLWSELPNEYKSFHLIFVDVDMIGIFISFVSINAVLFY